MDASSCLVTVRPEEAGAAAAANPGEGLLLTPWEQHAQVRYSRKLPEGVEAAVDDAAAAAGAGGGTGDAAAGSSKARRGAKRARIALAADGGDEEQQPQQQRSSCSIM